MLRKLLFISINILTLVIVTLVLLVSTSQARTPSLYAKPSAKMNDFAENELVDKKAYLLRYGYFTDDSMNEAYTHQFGLIFCLSGEDLRNSKLKRGVWFAMRMETGFLMAEGKPLQRYSNFDIVDESLSMFVLPFSLTMTRELSDFKRSDIMTYWGLGFGFFFGFERMECHVTKQTTTTIDHYEWHDTCYRHSFAGHGLVGINWDISEKFSFLCELRWTQGGKGRLKRAELSESQILAGYEDVFADFQHPDFNFTGASLDIGVKW